MAPTLSGPLAAAAVFGAALAGRPALARGGASGCAGRPAVSVPREPAEGIAEVALFLARALVVPAFVRAAGFAARLGLFGAGAALRAFAPLALRAGMLADFRARVWMVRVELFFFVAMSGPRVVSVHRALPSVRTQGMPGVAEAREAPPRGREDLTEPLRAPRNVSGTRASSLSGTGERERSRRATP